MQSDCFCFSVYCLLIFHLNNKQISCTKRNIFKLDSHLIIELAIKILGTCKEYLNGKKIYMGYVSLIFVSVRFVSCLLIF